MTTTSDPSRGQVVADAAEVYDQFFVPALFGQFAVPLVHLAGVQSGDRVLDVGCGTGAATRAAAAAAGPAGSVVGLDCNEAMLRVARRAPESVTWRHGVAEQLPHDDASFDRVLSQFVLMFVDDPGRVLSEMARVAAPGGTVTVATWAAVAESPGYAAMVEVLRRVVGEDAARALEAPFTIGTPDALRDLLSPVLGDVSVRRREGTARFDSIEAWVHTDIRGWTLADAVDDETYERLLAEAQRVLDVYAGADGRVRFPAPALFARGTVG